MTNQTCSVCRFMRASGDAMTCRRYPPTVHVVTASREFQTNAAGLVGWTDNTADISLWPVVVEGAWCGEFKEAAGARR